MLVLSTRIKSIRILKNFVQGKIMFTERLEKAKKSKKQEVQLRVIKTKKGTIHSA